MDDRPEWELALEAQQGDVDRGGDLVPLGHWRDHLELLTAAIRQRNGLDSAGQPLHEYSAALVLEHQRWLDEQAARSPSAA